MVSLEQTQNAIDFSPYPVIRFVSTILTLVQQNRHDCITLVSKRPQSIEIA